jgi:heat shock protein HslJ
MKRIFITTAIFIFTLMFVSQASAQGAQLSGEWTLTRMVRDTWDVPLVTTGKTPTIKFMDEGLSGNGGCNSYGGTFTTKGSKGFKAGPIRSTKMACMQGGVSGQETAFFDILDKADTYRITGNTLTLSSGGGAYSLTFQKKLAPENKPFLWIVDKKMVDCRGIVHQNCLQVKKTDAAEWEILREPIKGFKYLPGKYYLIRVTRTLKKWAPANDFIYEYKLVKVISRTRQMTHVD